ncbi:protoglobin domain-containing protein, partial [Aliarcobacter butzleri]|uniref:protoglobin domain-containing protein n=1 Tax=Aliarcobacter butzleri TaxID=28197 RepID=UPI003AF41EC5
PLTDVFYHQMMKDSAASFFLSDSLVKSKLGQTMQVWLTMVFPPASTQSFTEVVHYQEKIGAVHARIGIPPHLVMRGMRALN